MLYYNLKYIYSNVDKNTGYMRNLNFKEKDDAMDKLEMYKEAYSKTPNVKVLMEITTDEICVYNIKIKDDIYVNIILEEVDSNKIELR